MSEMQFLDGDLGNANALKRGSSQAPGMREPASVQHGGKGVDGTTKPATFTLPWPLKVLSPNARMQGRMLPAYKARLVAVFGDGWEAGHQRVKAMHRALSRNQITTEEAP